MHITAASFGRYRFGPRSGAPCRRKSRNDGVRLARVEFRAPLLEDEGPSTCRSPRSLPCPTPHRIASPQRQQGVSVSHQPVARISTSIGAFPSATHRATEIGRTTTVALHSRGPGHSVPEVGFARPPFTLRSGCRSAPKPCLGLGEAGPTILGVLTSTMHGATGVGRTTTHRATEIVRTTTVARHSRGPGHSVPEVGFARAPFTLRSGCRSAPKPCLGLGEAGPMFLRSLTSTTHGATGVGRTTTLGEAWPTRRDSLGSSCC